MPQQLRCVECGASIEHVYKEYSKGNIRLSVCEACGQVADKYVEYEIMLIGIDLLLLKPQAYRHLLWNRTPSISRSNLMKMYIMSNLLDMNMRSFLLEEKQLIILSPTSIYRNVLVQGTSPSQVSQFSLHMLGMAVLDNLVYMMTIGWLVLWVWPKRIKSIGYLKFFEIVLISSFGKIFILFSIIWHYHWSIIPIIGGFVLTSNHVGLSLYVNHDRSYRVLAIVLFATALRLALQMALYLMGNDVIFLTLI